jgi:xanthine/uracil permease
MDVKDMKEKSILGIMQWFIFLLANSIALPVIIGNLFHLSAVEVSTLMQRTFFVVGVASFLQAWIGHRLPIADGPAGSWVGVFTILAYAAINQGQDVSQTLQILEMGMIVTGVILILLGVTGFVQRILSIFTPIVTGTFLLLLCFQLSGVFLKGMLHLESIDSKIDVFTAAVSFFVFLLVIFLSVLAKGWVKGYAVLIGILFGWAAFIVTGQIDRTSLGGHLVSLPDIFSWGSPQWNTGMFVSTILMALILVSNTIAAITATNQVIFHEAKVERRQLNNGTLVGGVAHILSSVFSTVGVVPLPVSAGFIRLTRQKEIFPFLSACLLLAIISFFPIITQYLSLLPGPVASAALLASFVQLISISFQNITRVPFEERNLTILGIGILLGSGVMFLPPAAFQGLPSIIQYVFGNGLFVGTAAVIVLQQIWPANHPNVQKDAA